jgi:hypothetical protein
MVRAPDVTVRRAVPDDAEGIVALLDAVAREGTLGVPGSPRRPVEERALLAGTAGIACASWVAEAEGRIGGHLLAVRGPAPYLRHVADVAVAVARAGPRQDLRQRARRQRAGPRALRQPGFCRGGPAARTAPDRRGDPG